AGLIGEEGNFRATTLAVEILREERLHEGLSVLGRGREALGHDVQAVWLLELVVPEGQLRGSAGAAQEGAVEALDVITVVAAEEFVEEHLNECLVVRQGRTDVDDAGAGEDDRAGGLAVAGEDVAACGQLGTGGDVGQDDGGRARDALGGKAAEVVAADAAEDA